MDRFQTVKSLGTGTYGSVYLAKNKANGECVAIKQMKKKFYSWDEAVALPEVQSLRVLKHENIGKADLFSTALTNQGVVFYE